MKVKLIVLCSALIIAAAAWGGESSDGLVLFEQGNASYSKGEFAPAIADYEQALSLGLESAALYYNLGNAYFKDGALGKAILNYLRARRLAPADADLKYNLDYARSLIKGPKVVLQRSWLKRLFFAAAGAFSLDRLTLLSSIVYFILAALIISFILAKGLRRILAYFIYPASIVLIICLSLFLAKFYQAVIQKQAVVITASSDSKFEPLDEATTYFTLYEGESVFISAARGEWVKVRRTDGRRGWLRKSDIAPLQEGG